MSTVALTRPAPSVMDKVKSVFASFTEAQSRARAVQRLAEMSDRQLADVGIAREDIVQHVFRDA